MTHLKKILLAFSGGIDSCAAVKILRTQGFEVEAMTINMMGDQTMLEQAREGAARVGVTLHIVDGRELFEREIIEEFMSEYMSGRTPAPCTRCNTLIKWELLAAKADELGIYHIATGHYFRISELRGKHYVTRGRDPKKDQSYYLWGVRQEILERAVTPMGEVIKEEVKALSINKKESMGVCFLRGRHYTDLLVERYGQLTNGEVVTTKGEVVGVHNGIARYTIGQRRGEGIPAGLRVVRINAKKNQVEVGDNSLLFTSRLIIDRCYFVDAEEVATSEEVTVMIRGLGLNPEGYARVRLLDNDTAEVELDSPSWAAAEGQPIVLYIENRVVGGGYLRSCHNED